MEKTIQHTTALLKEQEQKIRQAAAYALELAEKAGASAEVGVTKATGLSVSTRFQEIENLEFHNDGALGISVYVGKQKGNSSTSDLTPEAIRRSVEAALTIARYTSADECAGLAPEELMEFNPPDLELYHPADISVEQAVELAKEAEQAALNYDPKITNSEGGAFNEVRGIRVYGNTYGVLNSYLSSRYSISCGVIASENGHLEREYDYNVSRYFDRLVSPAEIGRRSAEKAIKRLNPQKLTTRESPVIFLNDVATGLFSHLAGAISGGALYRKSSFLLNHLGKKILPEWCDIIEKPRLLGGLASTAFDSEGVRTQDKQIIQDGFLQSYLLTAYSARKLQMQSTGNAGGVYNWQIRANRQGGLEALLKEMDRGLLVTELMGQGVNLVTGDYSRGAAGFWVENGQIQYPVSEITIAGNVKQMFEQIVAISDDTELESSFMTGSVLLAQMKISGN
ncbi:metalloprotease PmbA [Mergibacter septicus]|uniref:metalloprotease PmbA n=1 Tax=Mergibacter septicus TaxID=221402 RepID=UPI001C775091|nr:metalloprotease PmbA [Mergibacter septicus]QDJ13701.1 metalloprotease PmbA [Mergibacter septicus]